MQRVLISVILAFLALTLSIFLVLGTIQQGFVEPPDGTLWLGPVALSSHYNCVARWSMPCSVAGRWTLGLVIDLPGDEARMWRLMQVDAALK